MKINAWIKHDQDKIRLDLIPPELLMSIWDILTYGAKKYWEYIEEWVDYWNTLSVSNMWRIKRRRDWFLYKTWYNRFWYEMVSVSWESRKSWQVHRLVARSFLWNSKLSVNHIDWNKANNYIDNLEYLSHWDNIRHWYEIWLYDNAKEKAKIHYRITQEQADEIRSRVDNWEKQKDVAKEFNLSPQFVNGIVKNRNYKKVEIKKNTNSRNWENWMDWSRPYGALLRHLMAWWSWNDKDEETWRSHLWHAWCCIAFLITYEARWIWNDDRNKIKKYLCKQTTNRKKIK